MMPSDPRSMWLSTEAHGSIAKGVAGGDRLSSGYDSSIRLSDERTRSLEMWWSNPPAVPRCNPVGGSSFDESRLKDIRHNIGRFSLTTVGVGMLLMVVMEWAGFIAG
ncbi:MAG: hypothetical protein U0929_09460 [Planctomycetaceae bacterium]